MFSRGIIMRSCTLRLILLASLVALVSCYPPESCGNDFCLNGGTCNEDGGCTCPQGSLGDNCQYKDASVTCDKTNKAEYVFYFPPGLSSDVLVKNDDRKLCDVKKSFTNGRLLAYTLVVDLNRKQNLNDCASLVDIDIETFSLEFVIENGTSTEEKTLTCTQED